MAGFIDKIYGSNGVPQPQDEHGTNVLSECSASANSVWAGYSNNTVEKNLSDSAKAEKFAKNQEAAKLGLKPTGNGSYYFDEAKDTYYLWQPDKGTFKKDKNISMICSNGNYINKKGAYFTPDGKLYAVVKKGVASSDEVTCGVSKFGPSLAHARGYLSTSNENIYRAKDENNNDVYYHYDKESLSFSKTTVSEVLYNGMYKDNGKFFDKNGQEVSKVRYLAATELLEPLSETSDVYKLVDSELYYKWNNETNKFEYVKNDGVLGDFKQGGTGDCWLLASISALSSDPKGREVIKNAVTVNDDGSVNVYFKGIDKTYKITQKELRTVQSVNYAAADPDIIAVELAMERYRQGLVKTDLAQSSNLSLVYSPSPEEGKSILDGGNAIQALQLLSGKNSFMVSTDENNVLAIDRVVQDGKSFDTALKEYFDNPNNVIVVGLQTGEDAGHAYAFDSYDDENVYLINPHNTFEGPKPMKKEEFFEKLNNVVITDLSTEDTKPPKVFLANGKTVSMAEYLPD